MSTASTPTYLDAPDVPLLFTAAAASKVNELIGVVSVKTFQEVGDN